MAWLFWSCAAGCVTQRLWAVCGLMSENAHSATLADACGRLWVSVDCERDKLGATQQQIVANCEHFPVAQRPQEGLEIILRHARRSLTSAQFHVSMA